MLNWRVLQALSICVGIIACDNSDDNKALSTDDAYEVSNENQVSVATRIKSKFESFSANQIGASLPEGANIGSTLYWHLLVSNDQGGSSQNDCFTKELSEFADFAFIRGRLQISLKNFTPSQSCIEEQEKKDLAQSQSDYPDLQEHHISYQSYDELLIDVECTNDVSQLSTLNNFVAQCGAIISRSSYFKLNSFSKVFNASGELTSEKQSSLTSIELGDTTRGCVFETQSDHWGYKDCIKLTYSEFDNHTAYYVFSMKNVKTRSDQDLPYAGTVDFQFYDNSGSITYDGSQSYEVEVMAGDSKSKIFVSKESL